MTKKTHISSKELNACAKAASKRAIERAQALGIPYAAQEGQNIVEYYPDGTSKIIDTLPTADTIPTVRRYRIA